MTIKRAPRRNLRLFPLLALSAMAIAGCARYAEQPLPVNHDLAPALPEPLARAAEHGLAMNQVTWLAIANSPDLRAARAKVGVADAEAFSAALLPDPQLTGGLDKPTSNQPDLVNAYSVGINYDLQFFVTWGAEVERARAAASAAALNLLWAEWQTAQKARVLFVQKYSETERLAALRAVAALFAARKEASERALRMGDVTLDVAGADLAAFLDAEARVRTLDRDRLQTDRDLNALLGLDPSVAVPVQAPPAREPRDGPAVEAALAKAAERRPDLLALAAGYKSQEANLRRAVLAQFPALNVGFTRARDTSDISTVGWGITLSLPLFNRNRGDIRIQRATRAELWAEYQARLDQTRGEATELHLRSHLLQEQIQALERQIPALDAIAAKARRVYNSGDFPALTYITLENTLLAKRLELIDLRQDLWLSEIALDAILGDGGDWALSPEQDSKK